MFSTIRSRLLLIALLAVGSLYFLFPRSMTLRERGANGVMRDTVVTRVPLKRGLDLQGGMHLALELDQSKHVSADPKKDLDLALTVMRKRIDEFGVEEPLVQKVGDDRIVVELAGITDPARAKGIVQRSAFLEFKITDKTTNQVVYDNRMNAPETGDDATVLGDGGTGGGSIVIHSK